MDSGGQLKFSVEGHVMTKAVQIRFESPVVLSGPGAQHADIELMSRFN